MLDRNHDLVSVTPASLHAVCCDSGRRSGRKRWQAYLVLLGDLSIPKSDLLG